MNPGARQPSVPEDALTELGRCRSADDLGACLNRRPDLVSSAVVEKLAEAVRHRIRVDVDEAIRLADAAQAIAAELGDAESLGRGDRAKANALWHQRNLSAAVELFQSAVGHFERAGREDEVGRTLSSSIQALSLLGRYDRAFQAAEQARAIFQRLNDPLRLARLDINVANIHHRQDRFAEALALYERAYETLLPHKDAEAIAVALHNIAVCLIALNDFGRAMDTYSRVRSTCEGHGMPLLAAQADYNIAYLHYLRGDYNNALDGLRATRELCHQNADRYHAALCDLDQSEIYIELNISAEAERMARAAEVQFEALGIGLEAGRAIANRAIALHQQNDAKAALELFEKAAAVFVREKNEAWQALTALYQAVVLFEIGDAPASMRLCRQALEFFETAGLTRRAILCDLLTARILHATGALGEAGQRCTTVLEKVETLEAPLLAYQAHLLMGHVQRASGERARAYDCYQKARLALETLRSSLQREELRISFMKNRLEVYESLVEICLRERPGAAAEETFRWMERAKSRTLVELVFSRANPIRWRPSDGPAADRIQALRSELNWYYRRIEVEQTREEGVSPRQINALWTEARAREDELLRAVRELPAREEDTVFRDPGPAALEHIRASLHPGSAVLEYFQIGDRFIAAVVTRRNTAVAELGSASEAASSIRMLEFQLSKFRLKGFDFQGFADELLAATNRRLEQLYSQLIAPVAAQLKGCEHLVVVPHSVLHCVPFHALRDSRQYLIDRFTVSYAPSASTYAVCERKAPIVAGRSLLLGVPDTAAPWIRREIRSVATVVPSPKVVLGRAATERTLRAAAPGSRIVHIATHGVFRRDNPMFSRVRLADSYLTLYDLYHLHLPVELLALSGCGTGLSVVAAGDELLGLMRGLLCAGAQSLLLTLWDVHDRTAADFMTVFYRSLANGLHKGAAMREAMREIRNRHPHPYYWAPFVLVGKVFHDQA